MRRRDFLAETGRATLALGVLGTQGIPGTLASKEARPMAFPALRDGYFRRVLELNPVTSTYLGGDGYSPALAGINGRLRDFRPEALAAEVRFYRDVERQLTALPAASLSAPEQIDQAVVAAQLAFMIHQVDDLHYHQRAVDTYVTEPFRGIDWQIQQMRDLGHGHLGTPEEWRLVLERVRAIPAYLRTANANLLAGKRAGNIPDRRMVKYDGIDAANAAVAYFEQTLLAQAKGYVGTRAFGHTLLPALARAGAAAGAAHKDFAAFLATTFPDDGTDRFAAGEREYDWRLRNNLRDPRTAAQLWDYGAEQVALYRAQMYEVAARVAREAGLGVSFTDPTTRDAAVRAVMDHLSQDAPRNDDELMAWYVETGKRAVAYGREHDLFDIPNDYRLAVVWTPPVLRSTIDAAYYPAPPFKKTGVGHFYLSPTGNDPGALKLNNRASIADTAVHEGFPGHDWDYKYMSEHARDISNIRWLTPGEVEGSSSMWEDSMASEGWALYAEELMAEPAPGRPDGFYDPGEHLYELQGQMLRAVRVRVDTGIHTGRMSYDQAVDYYAANVDFMPDARKRAAAGDATARAEVETADRAIYRYSKWPTQAITYNLGKSAIVELREAYRKQRGAAYSAKEFHQRFMRMGTIPVGYFREEFLRG